MEKSKNNKAITIIFWIISSIFLLATLISLVRINRGNVAQFITYGLATLSICPLVTKINKKIRWYIQVIVTILIIVIGSSFFTKPIREQIITANNYNDIMQEVELQIKEDDDLYYFTYAYLYYTTTDGMSSIFMYNYDENTMFSNIYGKTIQQLIDEGKQLMKKNDMSIEKFKQEINNIKQ